MILYGAVRIGGRRDAPTMWREWEPRIGSRGEAASGRRILGVMARTASIPTSSAAPSPREAARAAKAAEKAAKRAAKAGGEPGRIKQLWQVFQMTRRYDSTIVWWLLLVFIAPIGASVILSVVLFRDNVVGIILSSITGIMVGTLLGLIILGRKAERAAFSQIEGQPGAVGAVLKSSLRRSWTGGEMPIAMSPRTQDAVYRAVGRGGVVLIGEGPISRVRPMLEKERANVQRVLPNVPVNFLYVGPDAESLPLHRINPSLMKLRRALNRNEVAQVNSRLVSLQRNLLPIPKGMDPFKVRAPRPR